MLDRTDALHMKRRSSLNRADAQRHAVRNKSGGTSHVTFYPDALYSAADLAEALPKRVQVLQDIAKVSRAPKRRAGRCVALEAAGATVLGVPDQSSQPKRPWVVRIYYRGECGDELCAEFGGLTEKESESVLAGQQGERWPLLGAKHDCPSCAGEGQTWVEGEVVTEGTGRRRREWQKPGKWQDCTACAKSGELDGPPPARAGTRLVEWPSELERRRRASDALRERVADQPDLLAAVGRVGCGAVDTVGVSPEVHDPSE